MLTKRVSGERVTLATPSLNHLLRAQQSSGAIRTLTSRSGFSKAAVVGSGMTLILVATTHWKTKRYNGTTSAYF